MPEGPEIRRIADRLKQTIGGKIIQSVELHHPNLSGKKQLILGHRVLEVVTRGKAMLIRLSSGHSLYSHNQLYGRWTIDTVGTPPPIERTLRLSLETGDYVARLWSATEVELLPTTNESDHPFLAGLGPDVLDPITTPRRLRARLLSPDCLDRKAATLMLDQSAFAGLGNYLRSEILFAAGVHPDDHPGDLESEIVRDWARSIKSITRRAYRTGGITVGNEEIRIGKRSGQPRQYWRHWVFDREGLPCPQCGTDIVRKRYGGRRLDYCPSCQVRRSVA